MAVNRPRIHNVATALLLHASRRLLRNAPCTSEVNVKNRAPIVFRRIDKTQGWIGNTCVIYQDIELRKLCIKGLKRVPTLSRDVTSMVIASAFPP